MQHHYAIMQFSVELSGFTFSLWIGRMTRATILYVGVSSVSCDTLTLILPTLLLPRYDPYLTERPRRLLKQPNAHQRTKIQTLILAFRWGSKKSSPHVPEGGANSMSAFFAFFVTAHVS